MKREECSVWGIMEKEMVWGRRNWNESGLDRKNGRAGLGGFGD